MGEQVAARYYLVVLRTTFGGVAQLGEHLPCKQGVMSSNLTISTELSFLFKEVHRTLKTEYREYQKQKDIRGRHKRL